MKIIFEGDNMVSLVKQNYSENKSFYDKIEEDLRGVLDKSIPITHVGSTAIPDMYGKNIIDILVGAHNKEQFEKIILILMNKGFVPSSKNKDEIYQFFSSTENETASGDIHIHLVISNTERYSEFIILKEYLLNNKVEAINYSNLKKEIISEGITDRKQYKIIKSEYVTNLLERAKGWYRAWNCIKQTKIYLIRHSEQLKHNGQFFSKESEQVKNEKIILSIEGEEKAKILSENDELQNIDILFSSNYVRAIATAKYMATKNNIEINIDERLGERKLRRFRGVEKTSEEIKIMIIRPNNC